MKHNFSQSLPRYAKLYTLLLGLLLSYCLLNAMYMVIIGGKSMYLWSSLILISQAIMVFKGTANKGIYCSLGGLGLLFCLLYLHHWNVIFQPESIAIFPSTALALFSLGYFHKHPLRLNGLKIACLVGVLILAYTQHHDLNTLQNYYDSLHNGETWQQYGAL